MADRVCIGSGSEYEAVVGYSRAVRIGAHIAVAGTTGNGADSASQTRDALRRIGAALEQAGASLSDVVRTRFYVTAMIQVAALISAEYVVEIEADAYSSGAKEPSGPGR